MLDNKFYKVLPYSLWLKHWSGFSGEVPQRSFKKIRGAAISNEAGSVCPAVDGLAGVRRSF